MLSLSKKNRICIFLVLSIILGFLYFVLLYGIYPLNVTSTDWIFQHSGDLTQHYLGWRFFRNSRWLFPIGSTENVAWPETISVIYLDCIPWVAIFFKVLSPILPNSFQYMGIYELFCFIFQIFLGMEIVYALIPRELKCNPNLAKDSSLSYSISIIFGGFLLGLSAPMLYRVFYHTALSSHYYFLLIILLWINRKNLSLKKETLLWGLLGVLGVLTHLFFIPIGGILILCIFVTEVIRSTSTIKGAFISVSSYILGALIIFINLGGFGGNFNPVGAGAGFYGANLNSLFNSMGHSFILKSLPTATGGQYEGFAYLGLGWIILSFSSLIVYFTYNNTLPSSYKKGFVIGFCLLYVASFAAAAGSIVSFNSNIIMEPTYPAPIDFLLNVFRSHGRFTWAVLYVIPIFAIGILIRMMNISHQHFVAMLITTCMLIQLVDLNSFWHNSKDWKKEYHSNLVSIDLWDDVSSQANHIVFLPEGLDYAQHNRLFDLADYALDHNMTLDNFYYARPRQDYVDALQQDLRELLDKNSTPEDVVIIFDDVFEGKYKNWDLHYYCIDDYVIGLKRPLPNLQEIQWNDGIHESILLKRNLENATLSEKGNEVIMSPFGCIAGPEWNLPAGHYTYNIYGTDLGDMTLMYSSNVDNGKISNIKSIINEDSHIQFAFDIEENAFGLILYTRNDNREDIRVSDIVLNLEEKY